MNPAQIRLVQQSFEKLRPIATTAADLFYDRLFELDPSIKPMFPIFKEDMKEQGRKLMDTLDLITRGLSVPEIILPSIKQLAQRHAGYGVRDEHYATVGAALFWTMEQALGEDFTPEVRGAWTEAYTFLTDVMISASHEAASSSVTVTLQAQIHAQNGRMKTQQEQLDTTHKSVTDLRQHWTPLQPVDIHSEDGSLIRKSWLLRLWQWSNRPLLR